MPRSTVTEPAVEPVVYVKQTCELRTVPAYFKQQKKSVNDIEWKDEVRPGAAIHTGQPLGYIIWQSTGTPQTLLTAPNGCEGAISEINGNVEYAELHLSAQTLLTLASPAQARRPQKAALPGASAGRKKKSRKT